MARRYGRWPHELRHLSQEDLCFNMGCFRAGKGADRERAQRRLGDGATLTVDAKDAG